jgi:deferrochelatase/peroxidase EfeB
MGFKDGTENLRAGDTGFDEKVWVQAADGPDWMVGGSYLVARRIRVHIEVWDRSSLLDQERTIGRTRTNGAPLGTAAERDPVDLSAKDDAGEPVIPIDAHVRLAHQATNDMFLLRRGYSFTDGIDPQTGQLDAGLFFLAYQRDPRRQFIPIQQLLAGRDALNEYIQHVGSAIFAVPPGPGPDSPIGQGLFA